MTKQHELYRIQSEINNMCDVHCDVCVACDVMIIDNFLDHVNFSFKISLLYLFVLLDMVKFYMQ